MALERLRFKIPPEHAGRRLDDVIVALASKPQRALSKSQARKLIVAGAVYLNGRRVRIASKPVIVGAELTLHVDFSRLETGAVRSERFRSDWVLGENSILFEDDWLIAVDKPAGLPTQPTVDEARLNLFAALQKWVRHRAHDPQAYVGLHHRLDRDTSGVVLFTKSKEANPGVAALFSEHRVQKEYRALCLEAVGAEQRFKVGDRFFVRNFLKRLPGKLSRYGSVRSGGDLAHTDFEIRSQLGSRAWELSCWPKTGRTHQIRVHLSEMGYPILGDLTYGREKGLGPSPIQHGPRLMLHAASLTFVHPVTGQPIQIQSPLPSDFKAVLKRLSSGGGA
jgi:RluA family pseudouridine synthase